MATQAVVRQRVKDYLYGSTYNQRPYEDVLNNSGDVGAADTTVAPTNINNWGTGDILEFNTTGEQCLVTSKHAHELSVVRGYNGTTAASVTDATLITKNPKFTISKIDNAISAIVDELYPEVYVFATGSGTIDNTNWFYSLSDTGLKEVLSVYYPRTASMGNNEPATINTWKMNKHMATAAFSQGIGISMWDYGELKNGDTFYYTFKKEIGDVTDLYDRQIELVVLGAVFKLMGSTVPPSTTDTKDTRQVTQPGQESSDSRWFLSEYMRSRKEENMRLKEEERFTVTSRQTRRQRTYRD